MLQYRLIATPENTNELTIPPFADTVTIGPLSLIPMSEIENKSMTAPKTLFDRMSVSAIQNQRPSSFSIYRHFRRCSPEGQRTTGLSSGFSALGCGRRRILQFRLLLEHVHPTVWRRIPVSDDCTLACLHKIIQAMNWQDYHLHEFTDGGRAYRDLEVDEEERLIYDRSVRPCNLGLAIGDRFEYAYYFGDTGSM